MRPRSRRLLAASCLALALGLPSLAATLTRETSAGSVEVEEMAGGLEKPWSIGFLPDGGFLVTELGGRLLLVENGAPRPVDGAPEVWVHGQGGLFDVVPARDFARTREVFLSYADPGPGGGGTALAVARLSDDGSALEDLREIFRMAETSDSGQHFGGRVVEALDGTLFLTIGDRGERDRAQDLSSHQGKVIRVARDGSIPEDNPFREDPAARPEIWSYGHRNDQGAALAPDGALWTVMHGPRGGDATHRPQAGRNYGWPIVSYGVEYGSGAPVGATEAEGVEQPLHYWVPSIAPSGLVVYSGVLWPDWEGNLLAGGLQSDAISRLVGGPDGVDEFERLLEGEYARIRDVREAPDGSIWFIAEAEGAVYRMTPAAPPQ